MYVDGFNFYYGAVKDTPHKWLNLKLLAEQLFPAPHVIDKVKYFTARVSGSVDPDAPARQQAYLSALATLPEVEIHTGNFLAKTIWRPIINLPVAGRMIHSPTKALLAAGQHVVDGTPNQSLTVGSYRQRGDPRRRGTPTPAADAVVTEVHTMEEKGSDVNLAAHLLYDAWDKAFDVAAVVSNDTDLVTPIEMVVSRLNKPVYVVCPGKWRVANALARVASNVRHTNPAMLKRAQFPDPIPGTTIAKPASW
jgi:uncharacterized LabA/DUF88 family protein